VSRKAHFTITDEQYDLLIAEAVRTGRSQAEIVRRALDDWQRRAERRTVKGVEVAVFVRNPPRILRRLHPRLTGVGEVSREV